MKHFPTLLILILVLAACGAPAEVAPTQLVTPLALASTAEREPTVEPSLEPGVAHEATRTLRLATVTSSATAMPTATEEPTATVEPTATIESTATPEPTATVEPTATAEPTATTEPTATAAPTVAPAPTATPGLTAEEQAYVAFAPAIIDQYTASMVGLAEQLSAARTDPSLVYNDEWKGRITTHLTTIQDASNRVLGYTVPIRFQVFHAELVRAAHLYNEGIQNVVAGVDAANAGNLLLARQKLFYGRDLMLGATGIVEALPVGDLQ
ncbi:MAG: hypothetical protein M3220_16565 [Chloroflexota bacterium]|nr:hypothetical protein [Chloroflexota bacterium]